MTLKISNVSKTYPNGVQALTKVTLTIPNGMCGPPGPNGAGKSTLMRISEALQEPDQGTVQPPRASEGSKPSDALTPEDE